MHDNYAGYGGKLSKVEIVQLDNHLNENTYAKAQEIELMLSENSLSQQCVAHYYTNVEEHIRKSKK